MLESLSKIQNPAARGLTAALTTATVITFAAAIAMGLSQSKEVTAYKTALTASLLGAMGGGLFGILYANKRRSQTKQDRPTAPSSTARISTDWKGWRNFVVARKVKESEEITSFYLKPEDQGEIPNFLPGQFLTIKLEIPGQTKPAIRTYSLSDYCSQCDYYRLSIKREPSPKGLEVPPGLASNFLHDHIQEGAIISAKPPGGKFILDVQKPIAAVLISNGVGITPMMSMLKAVSALNPKRPLWFVHGARDGRFHAFREEVRAIAQYNPNLTLHFAYSRPREEDAGHYHSTGYVDAALIQSLVKQEAEYFLCGSPPFLAALREGLQQAGVAESRVFFEMFTQASKTSRDRPKENIFALVEEQKVIFAQSQQTVVWNATSENLLEFAEANHLQPPYSCRQGICGTCQCRLLEGEVEYQEKPTASVEAGSVLICIATPKTAKVVLDL